MCRAHEDRQVREEQRGEHEVGFAAQRRDMGIEVRRADLRPLVGDHRGSTRTSSQRLERGKLLRP